MYTGKGETRDDKKTTTRRTMTQAGSKQQPVEGESTKWLDSYLAGVGLPNRKRKRRTTADWESATMEGGEGQGGKI